MQFDAWIMTVPSHREIAKACGVNNSTVSRALNDSSLIPEATRKRIRTIAAQMGWAPNPLVSAYMSHRRTTKAPQFRGSLAYIIPFAGFKEFQELPEYHRLHFEGAKKRAAELGYSMEIVWNRDVNFDGKTLSRILKSRGIPGVIFHGESLPKDYFEHFEAKFFAIASWGVVDSNFLLSHASSHYLHDMRLALEKIREFGYHKIALILSENQDRLADHAFFSAFHYEQIHHSDKRFLKHLRLSTWSSSPAQQKKICAWLEKHRPEVIIGEGVVWDAIQEMRWKVPEDVAFVSPFWSKIWPEIGGIDQCPEIIGGNTAELVITQLTQNERGIPAVPKLLLSESRWVDGPSIPPASAIRRGSRDRAVQMKGRRSKTSRSGRSV